MGRDDGRFGMSRAAFGTPHSVTVGLISVSSQSKDLTGAATSGRLQPQDASVETLLQGHVLSLALVSAIGNKGVQVGLLILAGSD